MNWVKKYLHVVGLVLAFLVLFSIPVWADTYSYYVGVKVYNNSTTSYTALPVLFDINSTQLASFGYIDSDALDTDVLEGTTERVYSVGTSKLGIFIPTLEDKQERAYEYRLDYSPEQTTFPLIVGVGGNVTIADDSDLELGGNFTVTQRGYVDTSVGSNRNLICKEGAFRVFVSAAGNITAEMNPGASSVNVTASSVCSGLHTINVTTLSGANLEIFVDDVLRDSTAHGGAGVTDNANLWVLIENEVMPYMEYLKIWIR